MMIVSGLPVRAAEQMLMRGPTSLVEVGERWFGCPERCACASLLAPYAVVKRGGASSGRRALVCGIRDPPWGRRPLPPRPRGARVGDTPGLGAVVDGDHLPSRPAVRRITLPARQPQLTPSRLSTPHSSSLGRALGQGRARRGGRTPPVSAPCWPGEGMQPRGLLLHTSCLTPSADTGACGDRRFYWSPPWRRFRPVVAAWTTTSITAATSALVRLGPREEDHLSRCGQRAGQPVDLLAMGHAGELQTGASRGNC